MDSAPSSMASSNNSPPTSYSESWSETPPLTPSDDTGLCVALEPEEGNPLVYMTSKQASPDTQKLDEAVSSLAFFAGPDADESV